MTLTRTLLKQILREVDGLDVFPAVDDAALAGFSPRDEGEGCGFVYWSRAADHAFDKKGALVRPLPLWWGSSRADLQMAFARHKLVVRIETSDEPRDDYAEHGTLVLSPRSLAASSDLLRLLDVFAALSRREMLALPCAGSTQSAGWEIVAARQRDAAQTAVFWHRQSHDAFDAVGRLTSRLHLHWRGDATPVRDALVEAGFTVSRPNSPTQAIEVEPTASPEADIERFADALAASPAVASAKRARKPRAPAGPFAPLHRYRGPDRTKPIHRLRFDPTGASLIVAQSPKLGGPEHLLSQVDLATGARQRTFAPDCDAWECGGIEFLPDGRMVFSLLDRGVRVRVWEPAGDVEREIMVDQAEPGASTSLSSVDGAGTLVAVATPTGVSLRQVAPLGAEAWPERARLGGPAIATWPLVLMSPDARHVVWSDFSGRELRLLDLTDGRVLWTAHPHGVPYAGGAMDELRFDPRGEHLVVLCRCGGWTAENQSLRSYARADGGSVFAELERASRGVTTFAFHPDGERVAIGALDGHLSLLSYSGGEVLASQKLFDNKGRVTAIAFDAAGARVAVGAEKGEIAVFSVPARG